MKLLTKEEENAHYRATLQGGILGGLGGLALGTLGILAATRRYPAFNNNLTLQMKAFLITSAGTFTGIIGADHSSRVYESARNPADQAHQSRDQERKRAEMLAMTWTERAMDWGRRERYKIVGVSWGVSMVAAFALVGRNPYLTGQQKLVQARVYAQGLTLAVLIASAGFEVSDSRQQRGKYEMVEYVDDQNRKHQKMVERDMDEEDKNRTDGDPLWKEMVKFEEEKIKERDTAIERMEQRDRKRKAKQHQPSSKPNQQQDKKKESETSKRDGPEAKKDEKKEEKGKKEDEKEEEEDGEYQPIPGKRGEGKMMRAATDQPEPGTSAVP